MTTAFLIAGDPSGDQLAGEVIREWHRRAPSTRFIGAGGPSMAAAGAELSIDLTQHAVIGLWEVLRRYLTFRRIFHQLLDECIAAQPDVVVGVDYGGFNLRFAAALRQRTANGPWKPKIVQFVSPQVWASRPGRAQRMEKTHDLLLSILPFEKSWYEQHVPTLRVEFVGHPLVDRHAGTSVEPIPSEVPRILLLPGSRTAEIERHLPVLLTALRQIRASTPARAQLILPRADLVPLARALGAGSNGAPEPEVGGLSEALRHATLALASTGTVTLECAWFGVPTLALYRTSWLTYQIGRRVITVKHLAMPNLLAGDSVMPEFVQSEATPENLARTALAWLADARMLSLARSALRNVVAQLGPPGAPGRVADHILHLLNATDPRT
jgi:lipid-A-disaccharide synthase